MVVSKFAEYKSISSRLKKNGLYKGIVAFGSARIPLDDPHLKEIIEVSRLCAKRIKEKNKKISFITGGGPSVMTGWLIGAKENKIQSSGMAITLPKEMKEDRLKYCDKKLSCVCKTFQARKALLLEYAKCVIIFKGGFGTMDELFETITLINTKKIEPLPILIYPADFYKNVLNFDEFLKIGTISKHDVSFIQYVDTKEELIKKLFGIIDNDKD